MQAGHPTGVVGPTETERKHVEKKLLYLPMCFLSNWWNMCKAFSKPPTLQFVETVTRSVWSALALDDFRTVAFWRISIVPLLLACEFRGWWILQGQVGGVHSTVTLTLAALQSYSSSLLSFSGFKVSVRGGGSVKLRRILSWETWSESWVLFEPLFLKSLDKKVGIVG
jgi:hypothetical protein